jgi:hypothetical protein
MATPSSKNHPRILVEDNPMLAEAVRRIVMSYHPLAVYRFAPQRPDPDPGEFDIMIIVPDEVPPEMRIPTMAYSTSLGLGLKGEIYVSTIRMFDLRLRIDDSLPSTVVKTGRLLYEHPKA